MVRKEGNQWILLNGNNSWLDIGIGVPSGKDYHFDACLYPILMKIVRVFIRYLRRFLLLAGKRNG